MKLKRSTVNNLIAYGIVIVAFVICQSMISAGAMSRSLRGQLVPICVYIVMAVSLNLTVGISGELSLGHAGFMSVGAFSGIVAATWMESAFAMENDVLRLLLAMVVGGVFAGIAGVIIGVPVLRLRGDYLAIVTLAFGEIIRNVLNCVYISVDAGRVYFAFNSPQIPGKLVLNGPAGATGVSRISTFVIGFVLILFTLFVVLNLINSRSGRAIMACRDSRIAAESVGINITKYRMMAFVTSAVLAGMAGALYGLNYSTVTAAKFDSIPPSSCWSSWCWAASATSGARSSPPRSDGAARAVARLQRLSHARLCRGAHTRHARHQQPDDARLLRARAAPQAG